MPGPSADSSRVVLISVETRVPACGEVKLIGVCGASESNIHQFALPVDTAPQRAVGRRRAQWSSEKDELPVPTTFPNRLSQPPFPTTFPNRLSQASSPTTLPQQSVPTVLSNRSLHGSVQGHGFVEGTSVLMVCAETFPSWRRRRDPRRGSGLR